MKAATEAQTIQARAHPRLRSSAMEAISVKEVSANPVPSISTVSPSSPATLSAQNPLRSMGRTPKSPTTRRVIADMTISATAIILTGGAVRGCPFAEWSGLMQATGS